MRTFIWYAKDMENMEHGNLRKTTHTLGDFVPLLSILAVIVLFTAYMWNTQSDPDLMFGMRMFMSGFFVVFGSFKLLKLSGFVEAYKKYDVIATRSTAYAYAYPFIEIALGIAYFTAFNLLAVNVFTLVIMLVGAYGVWLKLREKEEIPCACLGVVFKIPMTKVTLFEDLLMALMALIMIIILI